MTRPYSLAFKQRMVERLTGKSAVSALDLSKETGVRQQNYRVGCRRRVAEQLRAYLDQQGVRLPDYERWRIALQDDGRESAATTQRIRKLERELARKERALAEAAALLVLKKR